MCLKGTRTALLGNVSNWLHDAATSSSPATATLLPRVFWLHGMAGSGKSSVAHTVAKLVDEDKDLELSCFFCKRDDPSLSNPRKVLPTLAYRIAQHDVQASYRAALVKLLSSPDGAAVATGNVKTQFSRLFEDLLPRTMGTVRSHVIVIDALDECGTPEDQGRLAESILSLVQVAPWIKVFVTSRPEEKIHQALISATDRCISSNINKEAETDADIRQFIEARMKTAIKSKNITSDLLPSEINRLVQQAAGLFIWASTLFKYVESSRNPLRDLRRFLSGDTAQDPLKKLYDLYDKVLESTVDPAHSNDVTVLHAILGAVFVASGRRPLSAEALSVFLRADQEFEDESGATVRNWVCDLHAVLYEDKSTSMRGAVRAYHPSFLDFIEGKLASGLQFSLARVHRLMFNGCMQTMDTELKFNICQLYDASLLNKNVPDLDDRICSSISEALQYSSLFWIAHLSNSDLKHDGQAISSVSGLLGTEKFVFWLEVLSLLGAVGQGCTILYECAVFMKVRMGSEMSIPR
jgi:Cdc6-like AAA superfamily ATPase